MKYFTLILALLISTSAFAAKKAAAPADPAEPALKKISNDNPAFKELNEKESKFWASPEAVKFMEETKKGKKNWANAIGPLLKENHMTQTIEQLLSVYDEAVKCSDTNKACTSPRFCAERYDAYWQVYHAYRHALFNFSSKYENLNAFLRKNCTEQKTKHCSEVNKEEKNEKDICE